MGGLQRGPLGVLPGLRGWEWGGSVSFPGISAWLEFLTERMHLCKYRGTGTTDPQSCCGRALRPAWGAGGARLGAREGAGPGPKASCPPTSLRAVSLSPVGTPHWVPLQPPAPRLLAEQEPEGSPRSVWLPCGRSVAGEKPQRFSPQHPCPRSPRVPLSKDGRLGASVGKALFVPVQVGEE